MLAYVVNSNSQTVAAGGTISLGSIVRRCGCGVKVESGNVVVPSGYYSLDTNFVITGTEAGTAVITLYQNGIAIPGATASQTVGVGASYTVPIPVVVKQACRLGGTITAVLSGVGVTVTNASMVVS